MSETESLSVSFSAASIAPPISAPDLAAEGYPRSPDHVPPELTRTPASYRLSACLAIAALLLFFGFFFAIASWFGWLSYHLLFQVVPDQEGGTGSVVAGVGAGLLCLFTLSALLVPGKTKAAAAEGMEITEQEQPELLAFVYRLASEIGASRPRRIYLSARVNAAVLHDVSLFSLLWPRRRDLEIGLGLVNVLTVAELKAVLAHEFGHFGQRASWVGRCAHVSAQLATRIVSRRSWLEALLAGLTRTVSLHPVWLLIWLVAWVLRLAVWSIRIVMEACFALVLSAQRVLSRQMEFQADLVAVSVTGSDPLVQALYKLQRGDEALKRAAAFARSELGRGYRLPDLFALQSVGLAQLSRILGATDPQSEHAEKTDPSSYRLFGTQFLPPPDMWSTHPTCADREDNCKRRYVASKYPEVSAWRLFKEPQALRERVSAALLPSERAVAVSTAESMGAFERAFARPHLDSCYRGIYAGRAVARAANEVGELFAPLSPGASLEEEPQGPYGSSMQSDINSLRALTQERDGLGAIQRDTSVRGSTRFRGKLLSRSQVALALAQVESEWTTVNTRLQEHDKRCRSVHMAVAARLGNGWPEYLTGLIALLHYAEHCEANLMDARAYAARMIIAMSRHGRIQGAGLAQVLTAADAMYAAIRETIEQRETLHLDAGTASRMGGDRWPLRKLAVQLAAPSLNNLGQWLPVADRLAGACVHLYSDLRYAALDELLTTEERLAQALRQHKKPDIAPEPASVPKDFRRRPPGSERQLTADSDWLDRWQGSRMPAAVVSRLAVATALVATVSVVGFVVGNHGDAEKQFRRGLQSAPQDAARWYRMAADHGSAEAQNNLGVLYSEGKGLPLDPERAFQLFRQSALSGNPQAQSNLGFAYLNGKGTARDTSLAGLWLTRAAEHGVAAAQAGMGELYTTGEGAPVNLEQAAKWFKKAADQGDLRGEVRLGFAYLNGTGVDRSSSQAAFWLGRAAQRGVAQAQTALGVMLINGDGVPKDPAQAVTWFRLAADQGNVVAQANLGLAYTNGLGGAANVAEGFRLSLLAARQGNSAGQVNVGIDNLQGKGVAKDAAAAADWFNKAAMQGNAAGETNLGIAYANGSGVPRDRRMAMEWLGKAAEQNFAPARTALAALKSQSSASR